MKPGYKTTEFWLSLAAMVVGAIMASGVLEVIEGDFDNKIVGMIAMILTSLGYTVSRAFTKGKSSEAAAIASVPKDPS